MEQYIKKSALVAMIKHHIKEETHNYFCKCLLSEIDTLEVKEVNLESEIERIRKYHYINGDFEKAEIDGRTITNIAKHFFELGLKARQ